MCVVTCCGEGRGYKHVAQVASCCLSLHALHAAVRSSCLLTAAVCVCDLWCVVWSHPDDLPVQSCSVCVCFDTRTTYNSRQLYILPLCCHFYSALCPLRCVRLCHLHAVTHSCQRVLCECGSQCVKHVLCRDLLRTEC